MTLLAMVLILAGAIFFMAIPFFRVAEVKAVSTTKSDGELQALLLEKEAAYAAIKDLHFDYLTGKLSDEDYRALQGKYESKAIDVLKKIEKSDGREAIEGEIEEKLVEMRKRRAAEAPKKIQNGVASPTATDRCAQCGTSVDSEAQYCGGCGAGLKSSCPDCGNEAGQDDRFCSRCGAKLS